MFEFSKRIRSVVFSRKFVISLAIFLAGFATFGGVNGFFAHTNEIEFCTSCHSMKTNLAEYQETVHYKNASGVRAVCSDCHVPKAFFPKLYAKTMAVKDIYHEMVGTIDTKEKYEARRWEMASRVWEKMKSSDSRECRSCHAFETMDFSAQERSARKKHPRAQTEGKTCIDCHKGIAHFEPMPPESEAPESGDGETNAASDAENQGDEENEESKDEGGETE